MNRLLSASVIVCQLLLSCSLDKELNQTEADLLVYEWERLGNAIITLQKEHLVLLSQSNEITKIISSLGNDQSNGGYFFSDSLVNLIRHHHRLLLDLQDSTNNIYKKYVDERKTFSTYHRRIKSNDISNDKYVLLKSHYYSIIHQLDKHVINIRNRLTFIIENYNSSIAILIDTSPGGYQLAGYRLKLR